MIFWNARGIKGLYHVPNVNVGSWVKLLAPANADLVNGYHFYEVQAQGLGTYFRDSLFSDIDSLMIYHGIHSKYLDKYYKILLLSDESRISSYPT
ncbi:MAG: hypothetical protein COB41_05070 [Proteobacteria bacterium]|nr:MAG: hypothetical protein COB41_05070 [Pseudomonadota bacterium]